MIPERWYAVLESSEVRKGRPLGVRRLGQDLVFWRDKAGQVVCQRDCCVHRGAALSAGKLQEGHIQCPFHGLEYDAAGACTVIPANGRQTPVPAQFRVHTYPAREAHGFIYVWWGRPRADLPAVPFFDDIDAGLSFATARDPWKTHYSRVIENQLDPVHLPFVHHNTIGRGNRTIIHGPLVRWITPDLMFVYVDNEVDSGQRPRRPSEMEQPATPFPNLWENHISPDVRIVAAFVPVDEENTILYLRFYQRFAGWPVVRQIVNRLSLPFNLYVAHQDRRVVQTQRPFRTELRMGETLIQGTGRSWSIAGAGKS